MRLLLLVSVLGAQLCAQITPDILKPRADLATGLRYDAVKIEANNALRDGKFDQAIKLAEPLSKSSPDDYDVWYTLAQAYRLTGNLVKAEKTTQWLLDLRPENLGGIWEAALLREEFKDYTGSLDLLGDVFTRTPASEIAPRIRILGDFARVFDKMEKKDDAAIVRKEIEKLKAQLTPHAPPPPAPSHP